ncbi:type I restriction-modification system subunit M [Rothia sp. HMSC069C10]|uniref:type I restriction-modification system subunit M n=1 Tax=Rothia sp. HMSC069C10 TaxID=1739346 RepID=UPI0008A5E9D0|nr:type I restriction-modification system subunit M [Rothia sp. HMSC069C10]OFJ79067.1 restriction endonuclease [Rothia sp. HMSC069C10]
MTTQSTDSSATTDEHRNRNAERAQLHSTIWRIANNLRGSVDGWDFKQYVLGMLFYRYLSESQVRFVEKKYGLDQAFELIPDEAFDEDTRRMLVEERGFLLLPSQLFSVVHKQARQDQNLNETLANVFKAFEESARGTESEANVKGLFDDFVLDSNKLGASPTDRHENLLKLMDAVADMNLDKGYEDSENDAFGDAYEFLMGMYAANAGRSGGEYFTPQEVSELLAKIAMDGRDAEQIRTVYDPACGSGSLLLKVKRQLGDDSEGLCFVGQESNPTTYNLCRMNMILHGVPMDDFNIALGDTLIDPKHRGGTGSKFEEPFGAIVSNPPYSTEWKGDKDPTLIHDDRYAPAAVLAPPSKGDLAFTMHMLASLDEAGTAAIVEYPGVLYRGGAERKIREYLLKQNVVDAVIQLPSNLFYGTSIVTCILVLKKGRRKDHSVLFLDASALFDKGTNQNILGKSHREKILEALAAREEREHFSALVPVEQLLEQEANLAVSSWVEPEDTRERVDIVELNSRIEGIVARQAQLRMEIDAIVARLEGGE